VLHKNEKKKKMPPKSSPNLISKEGANFLSTNLCPRPTLMIYFNVIAAALILLGGCVGYLKAGSKISFAVAFGFAAVWLHSAYQLDTNTGTKLVNKITTRINRSKNPELALAKFQSEVEEDVFYRIRVKAYTAAAIAGAGLVLLMVLRVMLMGEEVKLKSPPVVSSIVTGIVVFIANVTALMTGEQRKGSKI
jgi:hypothetical protein